MIVVVLHGLSPCKQDSLTIIGHVWITNQALGFIQKNACTAVEPVHLQQAQLARVRKRIVVAVRRIRHVLCIRVVLTAYVVVLCEDDVREPIHMFAHAQVTTMMARVQVQGHPARICR